MTEAERWAHLLELDDELLRGGVVLSEWCTFIVKQADVAFAAGAHLASILTSISAIETFLRCNAESPKARLCDLIDQSDLPGDLREELHRLRRYRNRWVHVSAPEDDADLLADVAVVEQEIEREALLAARALRQTVYSAPML